ncbi:hypothetical protein KL929_002568 [Ogataea haglerorum]|nr:hypothetical protein KL929_002568 [Ogataea haglerorum]
MKRNTRRYARRQVKWIARTLTRELAREEQFGWPNGGQVVVLDATDLGTWEQDVARRGVDVCRRFMAGSPPAEALAVPETLAGVLETRGEAANDETKWQHHYCETCAAPQQREKEPQKAGANEVTKVLELFNCLLLLGRAFLDAAVVVVDHVLFDELGRGVDVVRLLRQEQVEDDADEAGDGEPGLHDENDGVIEAGERVVVAVVGENVVKPVGDQGGAEAEHERAREHKAVSSGEGRGGDDLEAGHGHGREQKRGHAAEHGFGNGDECGGEFRENTHHHEEEAAPVPDGSGGALGDGDDTVVLREGRHRRHGHERGDDAVESVGEHTALDARLVVGALDVGAGHVARGGDVADGLHHEHDVAREEGQHDGAVDGQLERVHPHEGCGRGGVDRVVGEVAACGGDYAPNEQTDNDGAGLHDGGPPLLAQDDCEIDQEPEPDELCRSPAVALRTGVGGVHAPGATCKVLKSGLDQRHTNEQHHRTCHDGRENALQQRWRQEREQHF